VRVERRALLLSTLNSHLSTAVFGGLQFHPKKDPGLRFKSDKPGTGIKIEDG